jgi:hypothetical protein
MKQRMGLLVVTVVLFAIRVPAEPLLFDFETGTDGWVADWGVKDPPRTTTDRSRLNKSALLFEHEFGKKEETAGVHVVFPEPQDFGTNKTFEGFSAWVCFPQGNEWEAQFYYHTGTEWTWHEGPRHENLQPGWHQIILKKKQMNPVTGLLDLGIQVKNFKLNRKATVLIDRVEVLYSDGPKAGGSASSARAARRALATTQTPPR